MRAFLVKAYPPPPPPPIIRRPHEILSVTIRWGPWAMPLVSCRFQAPLLVCQKFCLSVCLPACLPVCLSICVSLIAQPEGRWMEVHVFEGTAWVWRWRESNCLRNPSSGSAFPIDFLLPPLEMHTATRRLKKKLCCSFEVQRWPLLTALVLGSYPAGLQCLCSGCTENNWHLLLTFH